MFWFELISFILFVILMTVGYRKNKRNWMLSASLILLVGLAGADFVKGGTHFLEGFKEGWNEKDKELHTKP
jgi:uncharacterized membrane protein YoaK (UPF0700 family)